MPSFKDTNNREWRVDLNVAVLTRVKKTLGVDLMDAVGGKLIERLLVDPELLCNILYVMCEDQMAAHVPVVTDVEFGKAMGGDAIGHGTTALVDAIIAFCPSPRDRANLGRVMSMFKTAMDKAQDLTESKLPLMGRTIDRLIGEASAQMDRELLGISLTNAPASSGSTLEDSLSAP